MGEIRFCPSGSLTPQKLARGRESERHASLRKNRANSSRAVGRRQIFWQFVDRLFVFG
jgi:hypothetical protein